MEDYSNVIFCSISYRRNIKDMPFVKTLTDTELAVGVARSMSEIFGDELEFKSLKNMPLEQCLLLLEDGIISEELIENKDVSAFGANEDKTKFVYVNEQDHIRIVSKNKGFSLDKCYNDANQMDDKVLDKLEVCFDGDLGYLTSNPSLFGTAMEISVGLFIPAIIKNNKLDIIKKELLKDEYELFSLNMQTYDDSCFVVIKNKYTFGYKENEFASNMQRIIQKICKYEALEESNIFDLSSSKMVDEIYMAVGNLGWRYRLNLTESIQNIGQMLWGIKLKMLKCKKDANIFGLLSLIKENHIGSKLSIKEQEKNRAKLLNQFVRDNISKGEVDV